MHHLVITHTYSNKSNNLTAGMIFVTQNFLSLFQPHPFNLTEIQYSVKGLNSILGDPRADSGDEGKSKRAEKYIWNEEK